MWFRCSVPQMCTELIWREGLGKSLTIAGAKEVWREASLGSLAQRTCFELSGQVSWRKRDKPKINGVKIIDLTFLTFF